MVPGLAFPMWYPSFSKGSPLFTWPCPWQPQEDCPPLLAPSLLTASSSVSKDQRLLVLMGFELTLPPRRLGCFLLLLHPPGDAGSAPGPSTQRNLYSGPVWDVFCWFALNNVSFWGGDLAGQSIATSSRPKRMTPGCSVTGSGPAEGSLPLEFQQLPGGELGAGAPSQLQEVGWGWGHQAVQTFFGALLSCPQPCSFVPTGLVGTHLLPPKETPDEPLSLEVLKGPFFRRNLGPGQELTLKPHLAG